MVCTANDLLEWKDFPKGLRVLLLDQDISSAAKIRSKLEEMDYVVTTFYSDNEALSAISDKSKGFHVAIVEVRSDNKDERFKFLECARDLPTIMTSDENCISTMMKCIALGAVEFLEKPLSEDKLRNIWQHVAHKAFNVGGKDQSEPMKTGKDLVASVPDFHLKTEDIKEEFSKNQEHNEEVSVETDKTNDHDGESKFVEATCGDLVADATTTETNSSKSFGKPLSDECCLDLKNDGNKRKEASEKDSSRANKSSRRKIKVDWTTELHKKFVQAVEQLGVDQAIPSRILELMNVKSLTRHNVASHLQKYRLQRRHILLKESGRKWPQTRHSTPRNYYPQKAVMAYPPYHSNHTLPATHVYPAWPPPPNYTHPHQMWAPPYYPAWQSSKNWMWNPYSGVPAEAWGCPTLPPHASFPQNGSQFQNMDSMQTSQIMPKNSFDQYPGDEVIDMVVKEAINKPWLPLPLGLKPPSTEGVISELAKQGISSVPPRNFNPERVCPRNINGCGQMPTTH